MSISRNDTRLPSYDTVTTICVNAFYVTEEGMKTVLLNDVDITRTEAKNYVLWQLHPAPVTRRAFEENLL